MQVENMRVVNHYSIYSIDAAAAAKSLQLCPNLCDLIDSSPPGSSVPGILPERTLELSVLISRMCIFYLFIYYSYTVLKKIIYFVDTISCKTHPYVVYY